MYEIDPKFLKADGSIDFDATEVACRKSRGTAAGDGVRALRAWLRVARQAGRSAADRFIRRVLTLKLRANRAA